MRYAGETMALSAAACWAFAVLMFRRSAATIDAKSLNLFKNVVASGLLLVTMAALGLRFDCDRSTSDWLRLIGSAVLGLSVADTLFFTGLQRVGASVAAVTDCAYAPTVMMLSALLLGEELRGGLAIGAPLVVAGLLVVAWPVRQADGQRQAPVDRTGVLLCLGGVTTTALAVVVAKPALNRSDLIEATTVRLLAGAAALLLWDLAAGTLRQSLRLFRPQAAWRSALPATLIGTYVAMLMWLGGIKYTTASRASLLGQMGMVFALVVAWRSGEHVPPRRWLGAAVALSGALVVLAV